MREEASEILKGHVAVYMGIRLASRSIEERAFAVEEF
jgi:hypothetical protein